MTKGMIRNFVFAALAITVLSIWVMAAQTQARLIELQGEVKDQRGDVIVGAKISLTDAHNSAHETVSDERGRFRFSGLTAGDYKLKVMVTGFDTREEVLALDGAALPRLAITLYTSIKDTVTVSENINE